MLSKTVIFLLVCQTCAFAYEGDKIKVGDTAPMFAAQSTDGSTVRLSDFRGRVVLLDFFATWCPPCLAEMPEIQHKVWEPNRESGLVVWGIGREHKIDELSAFGRAKHLGFTLLADPQRKIYEQYATHYIPRCYVVGKDGKVKFASVGYYPKDFEAMRKVIKQELSR